MAVWDFISGTAAYGYGSAKNLCSTAYGYGSATVTQIDSAVRSNLNYYRQDEEARSKLVMLGKNIAFHGTHEMLKAVPGYKVMARSVRDLKEPNRQNVDVKALEADLRELKKEFQEYRKLHGPEMDVKALHTEQVCVVKPCVDLKSPNPTDIHSVGNLKPEDVIRDYMMKEFIGKQFLDDLIIPRVALRNK